MAFPSLEDALNKVSNRYLLVVLSAKRARQINRGAAARAWTAVTRSRPAWRCEEIAAAKVEYRVKEEGETAKA